MNLPNARKIEVYSDIDFRTNEVLLKSTADNYDDMKLFLSQVLLGKKNKSDEYANAIVKIFDFDVTSKIFLRQSETGDTWTSSFSILMDEFVKKDFIKFINM